MPLYPFSSWRLDRASTLKRWKSLFVVLPLMAILWGMWVYVSNIQAVKVVRVGWYERPPHITENPRTGQPEGFHFELLKEIAARENLRLEYVRTTRWGMADELRKGGEFIMGMPIVISRERKENVDFSWPVSEFTRKMAGRAGQANAGTAGQVVGNLRGTYRGKILDNWLDAGLFAGIKTFDTSAALVAALWTGEVGFIFDESEFIDALMLQYPTTIAPVNDERFATPPAYRAFPVRKGEEWLLKLINHSMRGIMEDGTYSAIYRKYFPGHGPSMPNSRSLPSKDPEERLPAVEINEVYDARAIMNDYFNIISSDSDERLNQESADRIEYLVGRWKYELTVKLHRAKGRLNELLLLIEGQPRNVPYFAAFYYRQINDLRNSFEMIRASLEAYRDQFEIENIQTKNNLKMIKLLDIPESELAWRKNWIATNYDSVVSTQTRWIEEIEDLLGQTVEFQGHLGRIMTDAEQDSLRNYRGYYSYRFDFIGNTKGLGDASYQWLALSRSLIGWVVALPTQFRVVMPDRSWWPDLLQLFGLTSLAAAAVAFASARSGRFASRRYILPFLSGWLGVFFASGALILPITYNNLFFSLSLFCFGLAVLDAAWKSWNGGEGNPHANPFFSTLFSLFIIDLTTVLLIPQRVLLACLVGLGLVNLLWLGFCRMFPKNSRRKGLDLVLAAGGGIWLAAGVTAWMGYLYPAMFISVTGGLGLCVAFAGFVFTHSLMIVSSDLNRSRHPLASVVLTLVIPLLWLALLLGAVHWSANIFNSDWLFRQLYDMDLVPGVPARINLRVLFTLLLTGLFINFTLNWLNDLLAAMSRSRWIDSVSLNSTFLAVRYLVWMLFCLFGLASLGFKWENLKWIVGGLSVGFGFALKDLLENFFAGIIVLIGKQVRPGDTIEFGSVYGMVERINIRATFVKTDDNALIAVPNSQIVSKEFRNWTLNGNRRRSQFEVDVAGGSDIQMVVDTMLEVMNAAEIVLKEPAPDVLFVDFPGSDIRLRPRYWVYVVDLTKSGSLLRQRMEAAFREKGIVLAYPQLDVHLDPPAPAAGQ